MSDRDPNSYWIQVQPGAPAPQPVQARTRPAGPSRNMLEIGLLVLACLFLLDTFLSWQRLCLSVSGYGVHLAGCVGFNAWSGTADRVGQGAGVMAILAVLVLGLRLGGVDLGDVGQTGVPLLVYGMVAAGALKWLLVIGKVPALGAWLGLLLLLAIAIFESIYSFGDR